MSVTVSFVTVAIIMLSTVLNFKTEQLQNSPQSSSQIKKKTGTETDETTTNTKLQLGKQKSLMNY